MTLQALEGLLVSDLPAAAGQSCSSRCLLPGGARDVGSHDAGWRAGLGCGGPALSAWWCGDRCVKQLVISVQCLLPARPPPAVADAELVALGVGHDHPPAAVLGSSVSVKTA